MNENLSYHQVERDGPVVIWKFSRPPQNLASVETGAELVGLVEEFDRDDEARVAVLTSGLPGVFVQHFDVSQILGWAEQMGQLTEEEATQLVASWPPPQGLADRTSKPIICAINGPAEGGGCELALSCDFRFISREAYLGQPEVNVGFPPGGGGTQRLARMVGMSRALELCLSGRRIYADEAERLGLVVRACDPEELMPAVMAFAHDLAAKPPQGLALIKKAVYEGLGMDLPQGLTLERALFFQAIRTPEALEIMRLYVAAGQDRQKLATIIEDMDQTGD